METADGLNIEEKGTVTATRQSDGEEVELRWGKVDDPEAANYQDSLGIEDASWVENDEDEDGTFFIYEKDDETYKIYQSDLNPD
ncbi:MAG: hypothetical protein SV186_06600 [Candidatus Nanohaloarchaea archaeon]|nr:hypothetical protein [Candidatus Nanohaloarchaea archaeon]